MKHKDCPTCKGNGCLDCGWSGIIDVEEISSNKKEVKE